MKIQLARHSFRWALLSSARLMCLMGIAGILLISSDYAMAKSKAKKDQQEEVKEYVWPAPPSEPVIRFAREFRSEQVFKKAKKKSRWKDALLGEEDEQLNSDDDRGPDIDL